MRVTEYALMLGMAMGLSEGDILVLKRAAQFHDIGKLVIDLSCIQKPGKLTEEEWVLIRKHPSVGANIIQPLGFMEREQFIIEGLIRKSLVSKVYNKGSILVVANDNIYEK